MGLNRLDGIRFLLEGGIFCKINQTVFRGFFPYHTIALMEWDNGPKIIYIFRTLSIYGSQKLEFHFSR